MLKDKKLVVFRNSVEESQNFNFELFFQIRSVIQNKIFNFQIDQICNFM